MVLDGKLCLITRRMNTMNNYMYYTVTVRRSRCNITLAIEYIY